MKEKRKEKSHNGWDRECQKDKERNSKKELTQQQKKKKKTNLQNRSYPVQLFIN